MSRDNDLLPFMHHNVNENITKSGLRLGVQMYFRLLYADYTVNWCDTERYEKSYKLI